MADINDLKTVKFSEDPYWYVKWVDGTTLGSARSFGQAGPFATEEEADATIQEWNKSIGQ